MYLQKNVHFEVTVVNFVCQKVQNFWADSDDVGKINNKKKSKRFFFQCLACSIFDPQSVYHMK